MAETLNALRSTPDAQCRMPDDNNWRRFNVRLRAFGIRQRRYFWHPCDQSGTTGVVTLTTGPNKGDNPFQVFVRFRQERHHDGPYMEHAGALNPFHSNAGLFGCAAYPFAIRVQPFIGAGGNEQRAAACVFAQAGGCVRVAAFVRVGAIAVSYTPLTLPTLYPVEI